MTNNSTRQMLDTMLHPVRMRVLMALAGNPGMTPLEIAGRLSDVPCIGTSTGS
jgi:DNA-binding MarR family transcriptional regulator